MLICWLEIHVSTFYISYSNIVITRFHYRILLGMKEDDICELLKFERKMLRARISTLRNDKFIQVRLKMETGSDGKAQKVNYYFINYKVRLSLIFFLSN